MSLPGRADNWDNEAGRLAELHRRHNCDARGQADPTWVLPTCGGSSGSSGWSGDGEALIKSTDTGVPAPGQTKPLRAAAQIPHPP